MNKVRLIALLVLLPFVALAQSSEEVEEPKKPKDYKESEARAVFFGNFGFMRTDLSTSSSSVTVPLKGYFVGIGAFFRKAEQINSFQIEGNIYRLNSQYKTNGDITYVSFAPSLGINMMNRRYWAAHFSLGGGLQLTNEKIAQNYVSLNASLGVRYRLVALRMGVNIGLTDMYNNKELNNVFSTTHGTLSTKPINSWIGLSFYPQLL
jgi:hypothetical protein